MKTKICAIILGVLAIGSTPFSAALAAGFSYGNITITRGSTQAVLSYHTLDARESEVCDLTNFTCSPTATSTTPVVTGELGSSNYLLSPKGDLAFVPEVSATGATVNSIYKIVNGGLTSQQSLPVTDTIYTILFTPDESRVAVRTATALTLVNLQTNAIVGSLPWTPGDHFSFPQISADGRFVAYYSAATQSVPTRYFRLIDFSKAKIYSRSEQVPYWDLLSEEDTLFQFSPDGKFLLYKDDAGGPPTLYQLNLATLKGSTFQGTRLFSKSYSVSDFLLTDAHTLLYLANRADPLRFDLFSYNLTSGALRTVATSASYYPAIQRSGNLVFFNQLTSWGSQVMAYDITAGKVHAFPQPAGTFAALQPGTDITLPGGVHGALLLPPGFSASQPHQFVVWLHGGPDRETSLGYHPYPSYGVYDWMLEGLRESGVVVLKLDYTGSYGYGRPFSEALKDNVGVKDVNDVLSAVTTLKKKYNVSQTSLMGVSYGGYLALRTLVQKPSSFAAAISVNGVTDWLSLVNSNPDTIFGADFEGPLTLKNEALYDRASVIAKLPSLTTQKVVLLHSTADSEVSFSQSSSLAKILQSAGKNVLFTPLPNDDHVLNYQASAVTVCTTTFQTLGLAPGDKCTLNAPSSLPAAPFYSPSPG